MAFWLKLNTNLRQIITIELPKLGGSWVTAFFLVGLLVGFRNVAITRLRYFLLGCVLVLTLAQALGRTQLSEESPDINSENLLVLLVPPKTNPVAYPPYYPPAIQTIAGWLKEKELAMSDIPWAMAWYGQRQCVWLTLKCTPDAKDPNTHEDFFAINDYQKPINLLYLTPQTMDARFLTQWIRAGEQSWGSFILESMVKKKVPDYFPLSESQSGWLPEQLVLTDFQRWRRAP